MNSQPSFDSKYALCIKNASRIKAISAALIKTRPNCAVTLKVLDKISISNTRF